MTPSESVPASVPDQGKSKTLLIDGTFHSNVPSSVRVVEWWKERAALPEAFSSSPKKFTKFRLDVTCTEDVDRDTLFGFLSEPKASSKKRP